MLRAERLRAVSSRSLFRFSAVLLALPCGGSLRHDRFFLLMLMMMTLVTASCATAATTSYFIGNSLTWDSQPLGVEAIASDFGFDLTAGYQIRCARALNYIVDNPDDTCINPVPEFGTFDQALPNNPWSAVTLQPHPAGASSTLLTDVESILTLIDLTQTNPANAETTFYIYSAWPKIDNFENEWTSNVIDADTTRTIHARQYYEILIDRVRSATSAVVNMIPIGEVLYELDQRMEAGQIAGFTDIAQFFRDDTHLSLDLGRYTAAITTFATMFGVDPIGSTKPAGFYGSNSAFTPALYSAIQDAVWDVVSANPYAGSIFSPGDFNKDETVDGTDLALFESSFGIDGGGDADRDGDTDGADFLAWQRQFDGAALPLAAPTKTVPEPQSIVMLLMALVGLSFVTRTRRMRCLSLNSH